MVIKIEKIYLGKNRIIYRRKNFFKTYENVIYLVGAIISFFAFIILNIEILGV